MMITPEDMLTAGGGSATGSNPAAGPRRETAHVGEVRQVSAILLDVDGTLVDTYELYLESYRRALEPYLGYIPSIEEFVARQPSSERHFLADWLGSMEEAMACRAEMARHYEALHDALCGGMYEGVREMLQALRSAGIPLGVVTGKGRRGWEITAQSTGLGEFDVVITDDDTERPKPHPDGLTAAAMALGVTPENIVYIGDSISDLEAGRAAGMRTGTALWPKATPEDREGFLRAIRRWEPDWIFDRPADVTRIFASWC